jgi:hypothetical protein
MFDDIDFSPGIVTYDGTKFLDQEDIFQVAYRDDSYVLDVGWYRKEFAVVVIKDSNWQRPVQEKRCVMPVSAENKVLD